MRQTRCALAIAGVDPSGGAGIYADLRAFAAAGAWGCGAVAVMTVQSTAGLAAAYPVPTARLMAQISELSSHQRLCSIKIGALGSVANVRAIARWLASEAAHLPVVIDPVMSATRAARGVHLIDPAGLRAMSDLAARATLVTPNIPESEALLGVRIVTVDDAERAAAALVARGARAALVKGGHLARSQGTRVNGRAEREGSEVVDVLAVGTRMYRLRARRLPGEVHGTGCMLASLVAGKLATSRSDSDASILAAVRWAERALARTRAAPRDIGDGQWVLA